MWPVKASLANLRDPALEGRNRLAPHCQTQPQDAGPMTYELLEEAATAARDGDLGKLGEILDASPAALAATDSEIGRAHV